MVNRRVPAFRFLGCERVVVPGVGVVLQIETRRPPGSIEPAASLSVLLSISEARSLALGMLHSAALAERAGPEPSGGLH
jgi:hypothetical protein